MNKLEKKPRYSRISDIIELLILMASKPEGLSIDEIQTEFRVCRRTAERMRDSLINVLPQIGEIQVNSKTKKWGFINYSIPYIVNFTNTELMILEFLSGSIQEERFKPHILSILNKARVLRTDRR